MSKNKSPSRQCSDSKKQYHDITFSERKSGTFFCGECCTALPLLKDESSAIVPEHDTPPALVELRKRFNK
jgi:hypothetical protein